MTKEDIIKYNNDNVLNVGLEELDLIFVSGNGAIIKDINGKEYLDFGAQTLNVTIGHGNKRVIDAAIQQMNKLSFCTMLAMNEPKSKLAKLLDEITHPTLKKTYTVSGGSEANESAMFLAKRARQRVGGYKFISRLGAYHGGTYGAKSATALVMSKPAWVEPLVPGFIHVPMPYCYRCSFGQKYPMCNIECARFINECIIHEGPDVFAGIILEPIVSAKGVIVPPKEYLPLVRQYCSHHGLILIFDEIVDGFGRTGKMFAYEHYDTIPDILTLGKGISSGYAAFSAMIVNQELGDLGFSPNYHGFTMSGYPLANAVAYENIKVIIDENLVKNASLIGGYFLEGLIDIMKEFEIIGDVRGKGLLISVEIVKNKKSKEANFNDGKTVADIAKKSGLLLHYAARGDTCNLVFTPPLIINKTQTDDALEILRDAFTTIKK
jgi:4-aminobutyrate aminotransferase-like enzyme